MSARVTTPRASAVRPELLLLADISCVQFGSAFANQIFDRVGPAGVVLLRVFFTGVVLLAISRPTLRGRTRRQLGTVIAYGLILAALNWSFYEALHRLPLGVAVTIEFVGPLTLASVGSRRLLDGFWVLLAACGVVLLAVRGDQSGVQALGVVLALVAAICWASYILLAKRVGTSFGAVEGLGIGMAFGTLLVLPAGIAEGGATLLTPHVLVICLLVAVMSSLIPYTLEMVALRSLSPGVFGLLMSLQPAFAAIAGIIVLGQPVTVVLGIALALVVGASVGITVTGN